jgi:hypothetical protein
MAAVSSGVGTGSLRLMVNGATMAIGSALAKIHDGWLPESSVISLVKLMGVVKTDATLAFLITITPSRC